VEEQQTTIGILLLAAILRMPFFLVFFFLLYFIVYICMFVFFAYFFYHKLVNKDLYIAWI